MTRLALVLLALAACPVPRPVESTVPATADPTVAAPYTGPRKLVVLLIIDQLPQWAFAQKAHALTKGFDRLLREGAWHTGLYPTPATLTAPGHALLGTGEPPYHSGIVGNEWFDRATSKMVRAIEDGDGISTKLLRVPGLGDAVVANPGAKAIAVSLKDRSAMLTLGHAGTPIWYDKKQVAFVSHQPIAWLSAHGKASPIAPRLHDVWTPLDVTTLARLSGTADAHPGEVGEKGFGPTFPHSLATNTDPAGAIYAAPLGNQLVLDTALAAIDGEQLGADDKPDLLIASLSAHDYVGHGWGHESWEAWDMMLRLDAQLDDFLAQLDAKVGKDRWALLLTSDHGASPLPERVGGGRLTPEGLQAIANAAAATALGSGTWVANAKYPFVFLTPALFAKRPEERAKAVHKILLALRAQPGIAMADRVESFAGNCITRTGDAFGICMMLDPERAGDLFYLPASGWIVHDAGEPTAVAHGSWNLYDREVPVIMLPFGRTSHTRATGASTTTIQMVRIATVLAGWLGVTSPTNLPRDSR
ncbi:MAG: alkaline phosphatase family protein [Kofleriaceae bacterium]